MQCTAHHNVFSQPVENLDRAACTYCMFCAYHITNLSAVLAGPGADAGYVSYQISVHKTITCIVNHNSPACRPSAKAPTAETSCLVAPAASALQPSPAAFQPSPAAFQPSPAAFQPSPAAGSAAPPDAAAVGAASQGHRWSKKCFSHKRLSGEASAAHELRHTCNLGSRSVPSDTESPSYAAVVHVPDEIHQ